MRRIHLLVWAVVCLASIALAQKPCDLKTIEKGRECGDHGVLAPTGVVSSVTFHACTKCDHTQEKPGKCPSCKEALSKKVSGKDVCKLCLKKTSVIDVCAKPCWMCPQCWEVAPGAGKCKDCGVAFEKTVSRSRVEYACDECGLTESKPGKCTDEDCERKGKPLTRTCSESGSPPHGG